MTNLIEIPGDSKEKLERLFQMYHEVLKETDEILPVGLLLQETLLKTIVISVASHLERMTIITIRNLVGTLVGHQGQIIENFVYNKMLDRNFHSLFQWDKRQANKFYSYFSGSNKDEANFTEFMKGKVRKDSDFNEAVESFLELGEQRNNLVHNDLASAQLDNITIEDIERKYQAAQGFLPKFYNYALEFIQSDVNKETPASDRA
ncbi:MAG: HEPN domain-containing protein [Pseudohongiellaceae bacterium]